MGINSIQNSINSEFLGTKLMKCDQNMKDLLFQARIKFDLMNPGAIGEFNLQKKC